MDNQQDKSNQLAQPDQPVKWPLIKKALIFQLKLGLDAIRDILLSPISILLVVIDVALGHTQKQSYFIRLMHVGRLSDNWINLFGSHSNDHQHRTDSVDYWLAKVETVVKEQQASGKDKLNESAKAKINLYLGKIGKTLPKEAPDDKE
jgi:hypothetical protein